MKESVIACILLTFIVALGILVRFHACSEPMWLDECHTAWVVDAQSLSEVVDRAADGNQPPLYFLLVWTLTKTFGLSELSLRLVSLVAGSAMMIAASLWAKSLTRRWSAAVLVAGLVAFDGQFIFYATESRSYALVQMLGLGQAIMFWHILASGFAPQTNAVNEKLNETSLVPKYIAWTILSVAILYCHYTSVWLLVSEAIVVSLLAAAKLLSPARFLVAGAAIVAALVPVWWNVATVFDRRENWSTVSSNGQLWIDLEPWLVHWILIPAAFAFAASMVGLIRGARFESDETEAPQGRVLWAWIGLWAVIGPIGIAATTAFGIAPMALVRYSIVCWVAIAIFATLPLKLASARVSWIIAFAILGCSFFGNWWAAELARDKQLPVFRDEDWVSTVSTIADATSTEPVFQLADVIEDIDALSIQDERFHNYLMFPIDGASAVGRIELQHPTFALPTWNPQFNAEHRNRIRDAKGCWLIVRGELDYALIIPDILEQSLGQRIEFKYIPNQRMPQSRVHLIRIRMAKEAGA